MAALVAVTWLLSPLQAHAIDASVSHATFYSPSGNYIEIYLHLAGPSVHFDSLGPDRFQATAEITILFRQKDAIVKFDKYLLHSPLTPHPVDFVDTRRYGLDNGSYSIEVYAVDANNPSNRAVYKDSVHISYLPGQLAQSDIQLLASVRPIEDSLSTNPMVKNGYLFEPLPTHFLDRTAERMLFYCEIYGSEEAFQEDFMITYAIEEETSPAKTKRILQAHRRCSPAPIIPLLQQVDISKLPSGNYRLVVEVANRNKELLSSKSIAFQRSNPFINATREEIASNAGTLDDEFVSRLSIEELRYSLKAIAMLVDKTDGQTLNLILRENQPAAMRLFLFSFWAKENPADPEGAYLEYMRVARYVDERFNNGFGYGFETDRGYVFLKYGAPNDVITVEDEPSAPPYEIWVYNQFPATNQQNVKFLFYNPSLAMNGFVLLHSTARGEINNPRWEIELYKNAPNEREGSDFVGGTRMQDNIYRRARQLMNDY